MNEPRAAIKRPATSPDNQPPGLNEWFRREAARAELLGPRLTRLLQEVLGEAGIEYQQVSYRIKTWESFEAKSRRVPDPRQDIRDLCGIRVVAYYTSAAELVGETIRRVFSVDEELSSDKTAELGVDRLGYRAHHFIARLAEPRASMEEWRSYRDIRFEIQVVTLLGHAWAEFEHDRGYKPAAGKLPPALERKLRLVGGLLEVADWELDQIAREVEDFVNLELVRQLGNSSAESLASTPLDGSSVRAFLLSRLPKSIDAGVLDPEWPSSLAAGTAVDELDRFGARSLGDVAKLLPDDFDQRLSATDSRDNTLLNVCRQLMIVGNAVHYFQDVWRKDWHIRNASEVAVVESYGINTMDWLSRPDSWDATS